MHMNIIVVLRISIQMIDILKYFPTKMVEMIKQNNLENLEEIRIRVNKPIILKFSTNEIVLDYIVSQSEILRILQFICDNSIYSYQNQICNGYITIEGGHRVRNYWRCCFRK